MLHPSATLWACHTALGESAALVSMQKSALPVYLLKLLPPKRLSWESG